MSTFVEIQTDAFANNIKDLAVNKRDFTGVRRPVRHDVSPPERMGPRSAGERWPEVVQQHSLADLGVPVCADRNRPRHRLAPR